MTEPIHTHGRFVWRELICDDLERAKAFYTELFGWQYAEGAMMPGYVLASPSAGRPAVAGLMALASLEGGGEPSADGPRPGWVATVSVPDVGATVEGFARSGGSVLVPVSELPGVGTFAQVAGPTGALVGLLCASDGDPVPPAFEALAGGEFCWETLQAADPRAQAEFWCARLGWTARADGGLVLLAESGELADVTEAPPGAPDRWLSHVVVEDLQAALARAERAGGAVVRPATPLPGVGLLSCVRDPEGALICPFQPA